jgi:hypothetical protein
VLLLGHAHSQPSMLCCHVGKTWGKLLSTH